MTYLTIDQANIASEHICCAFSDKKCSDGYQLKKDWLKKEFENGLVFRRLDQRAKVFIEYCPAEKSWLPLTAPNYLALGCFWVSGQYKGHGHGKALLQEVITAAKKQGKSGLVTVVGTKKYHFMSDTKWLLKQGFQECDNTPAGFSLLKLSFDNQSVIPFFNQSAKLGDSPIKKGYVVYYSNRCPYTEYHVKQSLPATIHRRQLDLKIVKLETYQQAQAAPTPATIFSLFYNGKFVTTDLSVCLDSRFDRIVSA